MRWSVPYGSDASDPPRERPRVGPCARTTRSLVRRARSTRSLVVGCSALGILLLRASTLRAEPPTDSNPSPALILDAQYLLSSPPGPGGWFGCSIRVSNRGREQATGRLELVSSLRWATRPMQMTAQAPFAVAPESTVTLKLPGHGSRHGSATVSIIARDATGAELARVDLPNTHATGPLLFDLTVPSRIGPLVRGARWTPMGPGGAAGSEPVTLQVGAALLDPSSGDLILPDRAATYAAATVVLARGEDAARLVPPAREALVGWILGGGTLALAVTRPEDLASPLVKALVGGEAAPTEPEPEWRNPAEFTVADEGPSQSFGPPPARRHSVAPSPAVQQMLQGYAGSNLRSTEWGAAASYGLGEVHLLAFDPTREPAVADEWAGLKLVELVRHTWHRRTHVAFRLGETALDNPPDPIRRVLDPSEKERWAIAVAALILLIYSLLAGPVNFYRAGRAERPLRALVHLPLWALGASLSIVLLAFVSKGAARARHLTLVEAGAGMSRGSAVTFRGFYTPTSRELLVYPLHADGILELSGDTSGHQERRVLVDRDGARLGELSTKPWQLAIVREDGFMELGGGVSLVETGPGSLRIKNGLTRDLVTVLVKLPGAPGRYFSRISAGASVRAEQGELLRQELLAWTWLGLGNWTASPLVEQDDATLADALTALEGYAPNDTLWWPDDVPVLLGQLGGGKGASRDAGVAVDYDRVVVRVVGYGGDR